MASIGACVNGSKRASLAGLTDDHTLAQLGTIRWKATPQGKIAIESKDEMRSRGVKSPTCLWEIVFCAWGRKSQK